MIQFLLARGKDNPSLTFEEVYERQVRINRKTILDDRMVKIVVEQELIGGQS